MEGPLFSYPLQLNLRHRLAVIVGCGRVGRRKLAGLLQAGARVRLIDPRLTPEDLADPRLSTCPRPYRSGDLAGALLVFACTDDETANGRVVSDARAAGILCCSASAPQGGDFALPAVLTRGELQFSVSTGGESPALATLLRDELAQFCPESWGAAAQIVGAVRQKWLTENSPDKYNQQVLRVFWRQLLPMVQEQDNAAIDRLLQDTFGEAYSLAQLQLRRGEGTS